MEGGAKTPLAKRAVDARGGENVAQQLDGVTQ